MKQTVKARRAELLTARKLRITYTLERDYILAPGRMPGAIAHDII